MNGFSLDRLAEEHYQELMALAHVGRAHNQNSRTRRPRRFSLQLMRDKSEARQVVVRPDTCATC